MNSTEPLLAVLPDLEQRRDAALGRVEKLRSDLRDAEADLDKVDTALESIVSLIGHDANGVIPAKIPAGVSKARRRGVGALEAVASALRESEHGLTLDQLAAAVRELGYVPETDQPERAVRAAANRLRAKDDDFAYIGKTYVYKPRHVVHGEGTAPFLRSPGPGGPTEP